MQRIVPNRFLIAPKLRTISPRDSRRPIFFTLARQTMFVYLCLMVFFVCRPYTTHSPSTNVSNLFFSFGQTSETRMNDTTKNKESVYTRTKHFYTRIFDTREFTILVCVLFAYLRTFMQTIPYCRENVNRQAFTYCICRVNYLLLLRVINRYFIVKLKCTAMFRTLSKYYNTQVGEHVNTCTKFRIQGEWVFLPWTLFVYDRS